MPQIAPQTPDMRREISYATAARTRSGRALIPGIENVTGRLSLMRRARGYEAELARGRSFWQVMPETFGLSLQVIGGRLADIPATGPLVVIANHPYGILDGLMMGHLLDAVRGDFRILANSVFTRAPDLNRVILPISFEDGKEALRCNLETRSKALDYLGQGGAIGIFPGGTVSTAARPFSRPMDPGWRNFTAKMIAKSGATVVPVYFPGHNSRLFQIASHLHANLRLALLLNEFKRRTDAPVPVVIGSAIRPDDPVLQHGDPARLMQSLRRATYALSPAPLPSYDYGYEFEAKYKTR